MSAVTSDAGAIHPAAIVDPAATLGADVRIGPFCVVGPHASLGDGVVLHSHVVVEGRTSIGAGTEIFPFASIGHKPQDLKFSGEPSRLEIGAGNVIREHVTMNPGTEGGGMLTKVGNNGLFMMGAHVAHDCQIGDHVIMVNNATLAGHVVIDDFAIIGGLSAVHQFVRIGKHAMIGGMTGVENDVIPFGTVMGERGRLSGLNLVGMKRRNFDREQINALRKAYRLLFASEGTFQDRLEEVAGEFAGHEAIMEIVSFAKAGSSRALCHPKGDSD